MTPSARLAATIELLGQIDETSRPADATASAYFRSRRYIGAKDRAEISHAVYRALRRRARLDWWLERSGGEKNARAYAIADLMLGEGVPPPKVDQLFSGGAYAPGRLFEDEQALVKRLANHTLFHPDMPEAVAAECPPWAEPELRKALGARFKDEMTALIDPAPLDLRVNPLVAERDAVLARLRADGIAAEPTPLSPWGIRLAGRPSVMAHPLYREGAIEIQDEGSQLIALLVDARPGQQVVDFCAGAGGKTLAVAATMENKGRIVATDVLSGRLERARERFRRAGVHNVQARPLESETDPWIKRHKGQFDRVLVDAPCSGTGTWRRNPDMRWRTLGPGLETLTPLQAKLLASAARLVKPGGRLIYATCSLLPAENQEQAARFLQAHPDFTAVPVDRVWNRLGDSRYLSLSPARDRTDGFFAAIFERKPAAPESTGAG